MNDSAHMSDFSLGERAILRRLDEITELLAELNEGETQMSTVQEQINEALAGDTAAIQALAARVTASEAAKDAHIATLEAEIGTLRANGVDVAGLESSLASFKSATEAIDPAAAPAAPSKTVYKYTPGEGINPDEHFTASGFEIAAVPAVAEVPAIPANPETGAAEVPAVPAVAEVPAEPVEYCSLDTEPGQTNGSTIPGYSVYTGPVVAVVA